WFHTGDQVMMNDRNEVVYIDRLKEIIKVRGFEVAPADLEACILGHALVQDAGVVGVKDAISGEAPMAFVVLAPEAAARAARDPSGRIAAQMKRAIIEVRVYVCHVAERKSSYKQLHRVEFVDAIPKYASGKILRRILQEQAKDLAARTARM
ncbi:hypothetical protein GGX14DRAFT_371013, partial [Mycena pura]